MPTYEYECTHCGHRFEVFQKMTDKPLDRCPKCNKKVRRLISSGSGIIFKGSGFYATDYRRKPSPQKTANASNSTAKKTDTADVSPKLKEGCNACNQ